MYYVIKYYTVALLIYIATFNEEKKLKFWVFKDNRNYDRKKTITTN